MFDVIDKFMFWSKSRYISQHQKKYTKRQKCTPLKFLKAVFCPFFFIFISDLSCLYDSNTRLVKQTQNEPVHLVCERLGIAMAVLQTALSLMMWVNSSSSSGKIFELGLWTKDGVCPIMPVSRFDPWLSLFCLLHVPVLSFACPCFVPACPCFVSGCTCFVLAAPFLVWEDILETVASESGAEIL